jgi:hypothetical protein
MGMRANRIVSDVGYHKTLNKKENYFREKSTISLLVLHVIKDDMFC